MGFWHTGYQEFHEPTGLDWEFTPGPVMYTCAICSTQFTSLGDLRSHRFEDHPARRPVIVISGQELGASVFRQKTSLRPDHIVIGNVTTATLNGVRVLPAEIEGRLAAAQNGVIKLMLANDQIEVAFEISIEIATDRDLQGVEAAFFSMASRSRLDHRSVEEFIALSRAYPTAISYCDGLCDYLYGVMAKEESADSSLPYAAYRDKFNRAADSLKGIPRTLAAVVGGLIAFNFNQFGEAAQLGVGHRIGDTACLYRDWLSGQPAASRTAGSPTLVGLDATFTDHDTEQIVTWSLADIARRSKWIPDIESALLRVKSELDRAKLRVLLAETHASLTQPHEGRTHALELINSPGFEVWAERISRGYRK